MSKVSRELIDELKRRNAEHGIDPDVLPAFSSRLSGRELQRKLAAYTEIIEVISHFVDKYLTAVEGYPLLVSITDDEGHLLASRGNADMLAMMEQFGIGAGIRYDETNGPSSVDLCVRYDCAVGLVGDDHYHTVLHQIACYSAPFRTVGGNGTISLMTVVQGAHPQLLALLCTVADYAEREMLLRKQNTQLQILNQALLATHHYGVLITDKRGHILELNEPMLAMLAAISPEQAYSPGMPVMDMPYIGGIYREVMEVGRERVGIELSAVAEGSCRYYILDVVPIVESGGSGSLIRVVGTLRDISELQSTKERLQRAEKLAFAGQLAASVAHEIRNPLTTVKGMLQLSKSKQRSVMYHDLILSELERMNLIVSELLLLGKPQAVQYKREQCYGILLEVLEVFNIQASRNGIEITSRVLRETSISCERNQIKQIFFNLLRNAMEALPYGGHIEIELDVIDGYQRIRFSDDGEGMEEEVLARIGEPFHTTRPDGTGLGMMVVQNIVSAHHGRIDIASWQGSGTRVDVYLPAE